MVLSPPPRKGQSGLHLSLCPVLGPAVHRTDPATSLGSPSRWTGVRGLGQCDAGLQACSRHTLIACVFRTESQGSEFWFDPSSRHQSPCSVPPEVLRILKS